MVRFGGDFVGIVKCKAWAIGFDGSGGSFERGFVECLGSWRGDEVYTVKPFVRGDFNEQ